MHTLLSARFRKRTWYLLACGITIIAGVASRHFSRVLPACLGKYPGDALWALMVFFGLGVIFHKASSAKVGLGALGFSCGIEALKLWHVHWLVSVRNSAPGHLVFGSVFSWQNLVAYALGILAGLFIEGLMVPHLPTPGARPVV